jgi:ribonuclease HI
MILRHAYYKPSTVTFPDRSEWKDGFQPNRMGGLIWYTVDSWTNKGTGTVECGYGTRRKLSFNLRQYTTVFQTEAYAIYACTVENLDRNYRNRNIYILSDSQAAIQALDDYQINSKLVWDDHQSLVQLAKHTWALSHEGTVSNEAADQLAKLGSKCLFIGPQPACSILVGVATKAVRDWT